MKLTHDNNNEGRRLVTAPFLAKEFGVSTPTIREWAVRGVIPVAVNVGRVLRFDLEEARNAVAAVTGGNRVEGGLQ